MRCVCASISSWNLSVGSQRCTPQRPATPLHHLIHPATNPSQSTNTYTSPTAAHARSGLTDPNPPQSTNTSTCTPPLTRAAKRLEEQAAAEKAKADAALAAAASSSEEGDESSDDDDDDDGSEGGGDGGKGKAAASKAPVTKLPSALELLETTAAPAFLSVPAQKAEFDVMPMKAPERWVLVVMLGWMCVGVDGWMDGGS